MEKAERMRKRRSRPKEVESALVRKVVSGAEEGAGDEVLLMVRPARVQFPGMVASSVANEAKVRTTKWAVTERRIVPGPPTSSGIWTFFKRNGAHRPYKSFI